MLLEGHHLLKVIAWDRLNELSNFQHLLTNLGILLRDEFHVVLAGLGHFLTILVREVACLLRLFDLEVLLVDLILVEDQLLLVKFILYN